MSTLIQNIDDFEILRPHEKLKNFFHIRRKDTYQPFICKIREFEKHQYFITLIEEYETFSKCSHSNIVGFYGIGERINPLNNRFQFFLIYESMGQNLCEYINSRKKEKNFLSSIEMKSFISNIFEACSYIERNVDKPNNNLKPENILLMKDQTIFKISDVGLRKMRTREYPRKYLPPLKKNNEFLYYNYDFCSNDIFSFAVIIMEVATLEFLRDDEDIYESNELIKLTLLQEIRERYGGILQELIEKMLGNQGVKQSTFKECRVLFMEYMVYKNN